MTDRVLSTGEARQAITRLQGLVDQDLLTQITNIISVCETLSQPDKWDGNLATKFRGEVPQLKSALNNAHQQLSALQKSISQINQNIMTAGGNG
jgi:uncharacterized protein YukE